MWLAENVVAELKPYRNDDNDDDTGKHQVASQITPIRLSQCVLDSVMGITIVGQKLLAVFYVTHE